ncbi:hypothetical protein SprV_0401511600 [Sparganum proliferum]
MDVVQILFDLSDPGGTGLINVTTLDIMKQPITLGQLGVLLAECPMPRLRNLSLFVIANHSRSRITECLKSELKLQEVAIRFFGDMTSCELLLLVQSFGDLRSLSLDDSQISRYRNIDWRRDWESCQTRIPQWTSLQIHHKSELLDLFLGESRSDYELSEMTLLTESGHFFPKRACVSTEDRCNMPSLQCPSTDTVHDDEAPVNFVACSLMTVEDNCLIHSTNLHDLYIHIRPPGTSSSTTVTNSSPSLASSPGNDVHKGKYIEEMPSLARDCFLPIIETCGPNLQSLEVSAELITACCSDMLTTRRLLQLQDKCLNVRKAIVIAGGDLVERQLRPSAKNISTYLSLFPTLKEVRIISIDIFSEGIIQEILTACGRLRRLYIFSLRNLTFDFASLPSHNALELLFMDLNGFCVKDRFETLLKETLSKLHSVRYILLRVDRGRFEAIIADLKNLWASTLPENVLEEVQQRINATAKDARLKKKMDLQTKLQSLLRPMNERSMATRVVNLSKRNLLPSEIRVLSKGIGFSPTDATPTNFLAGFESILLASVLPEDKRADIRSCATGILLQKRHQQTLPVEKAQGLRSLKSDHSIVVVPADKGGATVIMDKTDYVN